MYLVKIGLAWYDAEATESGFMVLLHHSNAGIRGFLLSAGAMARRLREGTAVVAQPESAA